MIEACERALTVDASGRRAIYEHFNTHGTIGPTIAREIASFMNAVREPALHDRRPAAVDR
jgi:hypothetical protein